MSVATGSACAMIVHRREIDRRDPVLLMMVDHPLQRAGQRNAVADVAVAAFQPADDSQLIVERHAMFAAIIDRRRNADRRAVIAAPLVLRIIVAVDRIVCDKNLRVVAVGHRPFGIRQVAPVVEQRQRLLAAERQPIAVCFPRGNDAGMLEVPPAASAPRRAKLRERADDRK